MIRWLFSSVVVMVLGRWPAHDEIQTAQWEATTKRTPTSSNGTSVFRSPNGLFAFRTTMMA